MIKLVAHGPPRNIIDAYTTIGWPTLCAEVLKLRVESRKAAPAEVPLEGGLVESRLQSAYSAQKSAKLVGKNMGAAGFEPATPTV